MAQTVAGEISHTLLIPEVVWNGLMLDILDTLKVIRVRGLQQADHREWTHRAQQLAGADITC